MNNQEKFLNLVSSHKEFRNLIFTHLEEFLEIYEQTHELEFYDGFCIDDDNSIRVFGEYQGAGGYDTDSYYSVNIPFEFFYSSDYREQYRKTVEEKRNIKLEKEKKEREFKEGTTKTRV